MEKFGQVLMAYKGFPEKSINAKKSIFDKHYDELFVDNESLLERSVNQIKNFYVIKDSYKKFSEFECTDQKIFYIIFITQNSELNNEQAIKFLEKELDEYEPPTGKSVSKARKLIQVAFKKSLVDKMQNM